MIDLEAAHCRYRHQDGLIYSAILEAKTVDTVKWQGRICINDPRFPRDLLGNQFVVDLSKLIVGDYVNCYYDGWEAVYNYMGEFVYIHADDYPDALRQIMGIKPGNEKLKFPSLTKTMREVGAPGPKSEIDINQYRIIKLLTVNDLTKKVVKN